MYSPLVKHRNSHIMLMIGHQVDLGPFPPGVIYLRRESDDYLNQKVDPVYQFHSSGTAWSEYGPIFENPEHISNQRAGISLVHYRCILKPMRLIPNRLPFKFRSAVLRMSSFMLRPNKTKTYVGTRFRLHTNVWDHFVLPYAHLETIMVAGARELDRIMGFPPGRSEELLKATNLMYPRNIYSAHQDFALEWLQISFAIAKHLDQLFPEPRDDRWGGFVLERLFSVFVQQKNESGAIQVIEKDLVYFARDWHKINLSLKFLNFKHKIKMFFH